MSNGGLTKLVEECGELVQVAGKRIAYPEGEHPDGKGSLVVRLEDEIADVIAAARFVVERLKLDQDRVYARASRKFEQFKAWEAGER